MDSITHISIGALIGEAYMGKTLGKRAMAAGAVAQSIPDIDIVASLWLPVTDNLLAHRGFTHSFLFAIIAAILLALLAERWHRAYNVSLRQWIVFFGVQIFIHLLLDALNNYGVGWFEPFAHHRISFNTIFVADPFYSCWLVVAFLVLLLTKGTQVQRRKWVVFGLVTSSLYLCYAAGNKITIDKNLRKNLDIQDIAHKRHFSTPTPLNNWLWYIVVEDDSGFHIGYRSTFDKVDTIAFNYFPRRDVLLNNVKAQDDVQHLLRFSQGYYTVETYGDTLIFNDLRFGQIAGWANPNARFAFYYYLEYPAENLLIVQRGRFSDWNQKTIRSLIRRIKGI